MKKTILFLFILVLLTAGLACNFSARPGPTPTPVETDACCLQEPPDLEATLAAEQPETTTPQSASMPQPVSTAKAPAETPAAAVSGMEPGWYPYTNANVIRDLVVYDGVIYAATLGGMVAWRLDSGYSMRYTPMDGMTHVSAYSITVCDMPETRILVGTLHGISIYDPSTGLWERKALAPEDSQVQASKIERLYCDQDNHRLLIGYSGLGVLDLDTKEFQRFTRQEGLPWDTVSDIAVNGSDIWVANGYKGLVRFSGSQVKAYSAENGMPDERVSSLAFDSKGTLWAGASSGILSYQNGTWSLFGGESPAGLADINEIEIAPDGKIWAATAPLGAGRLCQFQPQTAACDLDLVEDNQQAILALAITADGTPVIGSSKGISLVENGTARAFRTDDELVSNFVDTLALDPDGALWIGTDAGIHRIDPANPAGEWQTFRPNDFPGMGGAWASAIAFSPDRSTWAAVINGSASRLHNDVWTAFEDIHSFYSVAVDAQGRAWFGDDGKGLVVMGPDGSPVMSLTAEDGLPGDNVQAILVDAAQNVWIGTDQGLVRYKETDSDGSMESELEVVFDQDRPGLPNNYVRALALDADGGLIIGTFTGVARYDGNQVEILLDFLSSGYSHARLTTLAVAPTGRVWAGTDHGLLFSDDYANWTLLTTQDGLLTDFISALSVDRSGAAWVGGGGSNFDGGGLIQIVP